MKKKYVSPKTEVEYIVTLLPITAGSDDLGFDPETPQLSEEIEAE